MLKYCIYITLFLLICWQAAFALPDIKTHTRYFPVSGHDSASIRRSIQSSGPGGEDGSIYHAQTLKDIQWNYRWTESNSLCRVTQINVSIEVEYLLPRLRTREKLSASLRQRWDNYFQALFDHEKQHREYGILAVHELEKELLSIKRSPCTQLHSELSKKAEQVLNKYDRLDKEYDLKTQHGINQGIQLP